MKGSQVLGITPTAVDPTVLGTAAPVQPSQSPAGKISSARAMSKRNASSSVANRKSSKRQQKNASMILPASVTGVPQPSLKTNQDSAQKVNIYLNVDVTGKQMEPEKKETLNDATNPTQILGPDNSQVGNSKVGVVVNGKKRSNGPNNTVLSRAPISRRKSTKAVGRTVSKKPSRHVSRKISPRDANNNSSKQRKSSKRISQGKRLK